MNGYFYIASLVSSLFRGAANYSTDTTCTSVDLAHRLSVCYVLCSDTLRSHGLLIESATRLL